MKAALTAPHQPDELQALIAQQYSALSKRLRQIARYALDNPNDMALQTIAVIAEQAGVQPSALIRFAKAFGYSGFSEMQRVFQTKLVQRSNSYSERIRLYWEDGAEPPKTRSTEVLHEFTSAGAQALEQLHEAISAVQLEQAVELLTAARSVSLIGMRRSFPVAVYFAYALNRINCDARLLDNTGGMLSQQLHALSEQDVLLAISFQPYAGETADVVLQAVERNVPVIVLTDSPLSPIAEHADVCFEIKDAEVRGFRSLAATMCLAQALAVSLALRVE
ncbi:MAG: MurR/RpiR family transcriptional regulator [Gammaproteobacteria bacterium]